MLDMIKEGHSCCSIAEEDLGVSKTQIQGIVRNKKSIREQWETGSRAEMKKYSKVRKLLGVVYFGAGKQHSDKLIKWPHYPRMSPNVY